MRPAKDQITGVRLYHIACGRALWESSDGSYLWCDKCQRELSPNNGWVLGRPSRETVKEYNREMAAEAERFRAREA